MNERLKTWHPSGEELERILAEMRPIIAEFARRARAEVTAASATLVTTGRRTAS
jgi:hypothetical protein